MCIIGGMISATLALIAFIYFYALRWDEVPSDRKPMLYFVPILVIALVIDAIWQGYQV